MNDINPLIELFFQFLYCRLFPFLKIWGFLCLDFKKFQVPVFAEVYIKFVVKFELLSIEICCLTFSGDWEKSTEEWDGEI